MNEYKQYKSDVEFCRRIQKKYGKSYYFATKLFPKDIKEATHILYAFLRIPDEIVDNPTNSDSNATKAELIKWKVKWEESRHNISEDPILRAMSFLFKKYSIPYDYADSFLRAMIQDTEKSRYKNYSELKDYMYGSSAVVGLMMTYIIGYTDKRALEYAKKLAYAMQLTNFLRDIDEDYEQRNRIYMPQDELTKFNISEIDIAQKVKNEEFVDFMEWQISRARDLYKESNEGIKYLSKRGQYAVRLGSALYEAILDKIEEANFNIFNNRVKTSFIEKCIIATKLTIK
jgi:phytoene synthase